MSYTKGPSVYSVYYIKLNGTKVEFDLYHQHTLIKKFDLVFQIVNDLLDEDIDFNLLYDEFITEITRDTIDLNKVNELVTSLIIIIDKKCDERGYYSYSFSAPKKKSDFKLHIDEAGYLNLMKTSMRGRFFCAPITTLRICNMDVVRSIYSEICREIIDTGVLFKLERIIDSVVMVSSVKGLDRASLLWTFFSSAKGIDPQNLALRERNNIFYKGLPTVAIGSDPIKWFISMARTSTNFQMKDKITETYIAVDTPLESSYENSIDMLKIFIYEEITSNRKLLKLLREFPFATGLIREYVYPITKWIALPFISLVFEMTSVDITHLINILLLNIFVYKFLRTSDPSSDLFRLLTYKAKPRIKETSSEDDAINANDPIALFIFKRLTIAIRSKLNQVKFDKTSIYTTKQIESVCKKALKSILSYNYFDKDDNKIEINPVNITNQYIQYLYDLNTGALADCIAEAKAYLK